jgi:hypothetical protein
MNLTVLAAKFEFFDVLSLLVSMFSLVWLVYILKTGEVMDKDGEIHSRDPDSMCYSPIYYWYMVLFWGLIMAVGFYYIWLKYF